MSSFVLQIGLALAMMAAAIAAAVVMLRRGSTEPAPSKPAASARQRGRGHGMPPPSIEAVEAKAEEAARLGENILALVGPIDLALRDLSKRVGELHARVDVSGKMLVRLTPRLDEPSPEEKARTAVDAKLGELEPRLKGLTDDLSTLRQSVERITIHEGAIADTVETGLADFQGQIDALILRIERGEKGRADLSLVASLASLKAASEQIAQRLAEMERHFPGVAHPADRPDAVPISVDVPPPADIVHGAAESVLPAPGEGESTPLAPREAKSAPPPVGDEVIGEGTDSVGDALAESDESASRESEPAPWMVKQKERSRLRRRCLGCGQTKPLLPNERMCDDCSQLTDAERSRRRSFRKPKATAAASDDPPPRRKRR